MGGEVKFTDSSALTGTSSTLEEEIDKYKHVIPQNRLDDFDWNL